MHKIQPFLLKTFTYINPDLLDLYLQRLLQTSQKNSKWRNE